MHCGAVRHWADIGVLDANVEALLRAQVEELVIDVVCVLHVLLEADDGEALKGLRLVDHGVKAVRVVQGSRNWRV